MDSTESKRGNFTLTIDHHQKKEKISLQEENPDDIYHNLIALAQEEQVKEEDLSFERFQPLLDDPDFFTKLRKHPTSSFSCEILDLFVTLKRVPSFKQKGFHVFSIHQKEKILRQISSFLFTKEELITSYEILNFKAKTRRNDSVKLLSLLNEANHETLDQLVQKISFLRLHIWQYVSEKEKNEFIILNPKKVWRNISDEIKKKIANFVDQYENKIRLVRYIGQESGQMIEIATILRIREKIEIRCFSLYEILIPEEDRTFFSFRDFKNISQIEKRINTFINEGKEIDGLKEYHLFLKNLSYIALPAIVQDPQDGTLHQILDKKTTTLYEEEREKDLETWDNKEKYRILYEIASALSALHTIGIEHGDIATRNIFIQKKQGKNHYFLADFGLGFSLDDNPIDKKFPRKVIRFIKEDDLHAFARLIQELFPKRLFRNTSTLSLEDLNADSEELADCFDKCLFFPSKGYQFTNTWESFQEIADVMKKAYENASNYNH